MRRLGWLVGRVHAEVRWAGCAAGYWLRPYDSHLDARRWRWAKSGCERNHAWWQVHRAQLEPALIALTEEAASDVPQDGVRCTPET